MDGNGGKGWTGDDVDDVMSALEPRDPLLLFLEDPLSSAFSTICNLASSGMLSLSYSIIYYSK